MEIAKMGTGKPMIDPGAGGSPHTLREAAQQFESLFISQLMKSMRGTVPESQLMGSGGGPRLFREMLDQELADRVAESGGIGIGEMLYRQLAPATTDPAKNRIGDGEPGPAADQDSGTRRRGLRM